MGIFWDKSTKDTIGIAYTKHMISTMGETGNYESSNGEGCITIFELFLMT